MIFSDHRGGRQLEMKIARHLSPDFRIVELQSRDSEIEYRARIELSELTDLVEWFRQMDGNEYPAFEFKSLPLKFQFSHLEKGELYYRIILTAGSRMYEFTTWEQGRETATRMADSLLAEIHPNSQNT